MLNFSPEFLKKFTRKLDNVKVTYEIKLLKENEFKLKIVYHIPKSWYLELIQKTNEQTNRNMSMLDEFQINNKFYSQLTPNMWSTIHNIEKNIKKKKPKFKISSFTILNATTKKEGDFVKAIFDLTGLYYGLEK